MNDPTNPYASWRLSAAEASTNDRASFIRLTYLHLMGAILAFVGIEAILFNTPGVQEMLYDIGTRYGCVVVVGSFVSVSYLASYWARSSTSLATQYFGLGLYVVAQAVIFVPLLTVASAVTNSTGVNVLGIAAVLTIVAFLTMTAIVFLSGADFSFLRSFLVTATIIAFFTLICGSVFQLPIFGLAFISGMLLLSCGYILYDTSNVLHHYRIGQHVAASLALFASVALMLWYMIQLVISLSSRD